MNISFEANIISNTLPAPSNQAAGSSMKRSRGAGSGNSRNKRVRRDFLSTAIPTIPTNSAPMNDDSSSSLDFLAESLRECSQRLDSSGLLDFSGNSHVNNMNASMNSSMSSLDRSFSMGLSVGGNTANNSNSNISIGNSSLFAPGVNTAPSNTRAVDLPPLMSFARVRRDSPDRL